MLTANGKILLAIECALPCVVATLLFALLFSGKYTFHFQQVTLNFYTNGTSDFSANVTSLVRSLGTIAVFSLFLGVVAGAAIGITCSPHIGTRKSSSNPYDEELTKMGFVIISKTDEGTTYRLTELGRRFLRDYQFLERTEDIAV